MVDTLGINDRFNQLCEKRGISDSDLAKILDYNVATIHNWRTGESRLRTIEAIDSICEEFGCTMEWLVYGTDNIRKELNRKAIKSAKIYAERVLEEYVKMKARLEE